MIIQVSLNCISSISLIMLLFIYLLIFIYNGLAIIKKIYFLIYFLQRFIFLYSLLIQHNNLGLFKTLLQHLTNTLIQMINYFLQQQTNLSPQIKNLVQHLSRPKKYQPFHIDCEHTRKKICYCVNNPVLNVQMDPKVKQKIWQKYDQVNDFYLDVDPQHKKVAKKQIENIKAKIQSLSRREVANFVRSIKEQKNLIGEMIEY